MYKPPPIWYLQLFRNLEDYTIRRKSHQATDFSLKSKINKLGTRRSVVVKNKGKKNKLLIAGYFG